MAFKTQGPLRWTEDQGLHVVVEPWWVDLGHQGHAFEVRDAENQLVARMDSLGRLTLYPGFRWDGSSGPTLDGKADPVPSAVHDALYWALRQRKLHASQRKWGDDVYRSLLRERGMGKVRAWLRWFGLRTFGAFAARPKRVKVVVSK